MDLNIQTHGKSESTKLPAETRKILRRSNARVRDGGRSSKPQQTGDKPGLSRGSTPLQILARKHNEKAEKSDQDRRLQRRQRESDCDCTDDRRFQQTDRRVDLSILFR